jgi:hypothetical protein
MADYYSILATAVRRLDPNTPAARRRLYDRARSALLSEMQRADPPIARSEIMVAQMALDTAILRVEADLGLSAALEKSIEDVERDSGPTVPDAVVEHGKEWGRSYQCVQPNSAAPASLTPSSMSVPRRSPANQSRSLSGLRRLFRWRSSRSIEISEEEVRLRDTWLTELLARASCDTDNYQQDFAPRWAQS